MSMNMEETINRLKEPFPFKEVECKIQATNREKTKGLAVFYLNSRSIQNRLDNVVGPLNWQNEYMLWQDKAQICGISIYDEQRGIWVTKYDGAENTDYEPIKGGLSDSLKRAAVMWGLGRYLYDMEGLWVEIEQKGNGSYIKNSEKPRLESYYNRFVGAQPSTSHSPVQPVPFNGNAEQKNPSQDMRAYDYKVKSAAESGNSTCLRLVGSNGKELTAYVKKDSPGIQTGARIKNVKMDRKQAAFGAYYLLNQYELAA